MHLIQILLPLTDNEHRRLPRSLFSEVSDELMEKFGGLTAHIRSPAEGLWHADGEQVRDDIVIYEVMCDRLDEAWWKNYRHTLEARFLQGQVIIRSLPISVL